MKTNIELAREAGLNDFGVAWQQSALDRYTALVEARLIAKLLEGAGEPVNRDDTVHGVNYYTSDQIAAAVLREREECATFIETQRNDVPATGIEFAAAIRNRGTK